MEIKKAQSAGPSSPAELQNARERDEGIVELQPAASPTHSPVNPVLSELAPRSRSGSSSATSATATITAHVKSALANGVRHASTAVSRAASDLWSLSDLRTMLQMHANDPAFLAILRGSDPEQATQHTLASCRQQMEELGELIKNTEGLETHQGKQLLGDIKAVMNALQPLDHATPATSRVLKSIGNLINFWPVVVPSPLMGKQAKTFAFTMSTATKGVLAMSASALRPSADGLPFPFAGGQLGRDANEMHLYNVLINTLFLTTELPKKFGDQALRRNAEAVSQSVGYAAGISVSFTAIMLTPFLWSSLSKLGNTMLDNTARLGAAAAQAAGLNNQAQQLRARLTPARINQEVRLQLQEIREQLDAACSAFQQARRSFVHQDGGRELTRTVNAQCTHLLETLDMCSKRLASVLHLDGNQTPSLPRELRNQDVSSKVALMILATAVTGSTIYLVQPDRLGTINLLSDTCIVTAVMAQSVWNKQATRQDAMERFKGMCGGSMVIALALGAEKLSKTFADKSLIESSPNAQFYAGAVMSLMAVTMPGPIARGAELAMNFAESRLKRLFTGPEGTPLATSAPSSVEELQERTRTTLAYLMSLTPEELDQYEQIAGESMLQAIQEAGDAAQAGPSSSVTITEIDDSQPAPRTEAGSADPPRSG
ncbi:XopX family type III secretion system effector [Xanthomonas campestris]|uniref:XopX family type III secretion system effector n=1 Tax=Xanthomonas campestris TaxID=339 RepID=UPI0023679AF5|nr:XopX family type III secretion system effector [Xanthomonas campestris]WDK82653.1 type III secretion system effector protein [Xanthomonas campestris pv. campestris]WDK87794.1 type III secretion system effector protein [Xanthomonas campestris pv. campestris]WDK91933.1 type III secretion system effector protein [Xanthomonas campestris pv. campestris]WDL38855.1 type III secretion system effector protein [Xanthomonas campestris pv. campestris]